jgi:hypothetical protein
MSISIFDYLDAEGIKQVDAILCDAGKAAEAHMMDVVAAEMDGTDYPEDMAGPYCGCMTCDVRETLWAALPKLEEAVLVAWGLYRRESGAG